MNRNDYKIIMKLLDEGKIDEVRSYLNTQLYASMTRNSENSLMALINDNCEIDYPSYYQRTELHQGLFKTYKGIYEQDDQGFTIVHNNSNVFQVYDNSVLMPKAKEIFEESIPYHDIEFRRERLKAAKEVLTQIDKSIKGNIAFTCCEEKDLEVWVANCDVPFYVPAKYYFIAKELLGKNVREYPINNSGGLFLKSQRGRAVIMRNINQK